MYKFSIVASAVATCGMISSANAAIVSYQSNPRKTVSKPDITPRKLAIGKADAHCDHKASRVSALTLFKMKNSLV